MRGQKQHPLFSIGDWFIPANIFVIQSRQGYPLDLCTSLQAPRTVIMVKSEVSIFYLITAFVYSKCLLKDSKRNSILFLSIPVSISSAIFRRFYYDTIIFRMTHLYHCLSLTRPQHFYHHLMRLLCLRKILLDGFVLLSIYQNLARHRLLIQSTIKRSYFHNFCMLISICLMMTLQRMLPLSFLKGVFLLWLVS